LFPRHHLGDRSFKRVIKFLSG